MSLKYQQTQDFCETMTCADVKVGFGYPIIVLKMKYYTGRKKSLLREYVLNFQDLSLANSDNRPCNWFYTYHMHYMALLFFLKKKERIFIQIPYKQRNLQCSPFLSLSLAY